MDLLKWEYSDVRSYFNMLEEEYSKEACDELWEKMKEIVALSVLSAEELHSKAVRSMVKQR